MELRTRRQLCATFVVVSCLLIAAIGTGSWAATQQLRHRTPPLTYVACKCRGGIQVDGKLGDACWSSATNSDAFLDIKGPDGPTPWFTTQVKMLWDDAYLYVAAQLEEPRAFAHNTLHDSIIFQDNDFEVFIDPDGDNWLYYEIEINALGHVWDLLLPKPYRNGAPPVHSWETIKPAVPTQSEGPTGWRPMLSAVSVTGAVNSAAGSQGWSLELALPWSILKQATNRPVPPRSGDKWRINFSRVQWNVTWDKQQKAYVKDPPGQSENNWVWSPQWQVAMHQPETWGYLHFDNTPVDSPSCPLAIAVESDITWPARAILMDIYNQQVHCWQESSRFCPSLEKLGIVDLDHQTAEKITIETTSVSFVATMKVPLPQGGAVLVMVDQLSRLTQYEVDDSGQPQEPAEVYNPLDGWSHWGMMPTNH